MFTGAYAAGMLPSLIPVRHRNPGLLQMVNVAGAGLLLGAALCIVLPEGFGTFAKAQAALPEGAAYAEWVPGAALLLGFLAMVALQAGAEAAAGAGGNHQHQASERALHGQAADSHSRRASGGSNEDDAERASLLLPRALPSTAYPSQQQPVAVLSGSSSAVRIASLESEPGTSQQQQLSRGPGGSLSASHQALYGLMVHSAADGVALGSAYMSGDVALSASVAVAILVHKFPVAFGLSSFLKAAGWDEHRLNSALAAFAAAAPVAALVTYGALSAGGGSSEPRAASLCLLLSGGTVLHAGMVHVLPAAMDAHRDHGTHAHSSEGGGGAGVPSQAKLTAVLVLSSLVPLLISALVPEAD
ncbi:hypothetical protein FOA52_002896 [Chlamydomonas sp. UWO 241]|nr:hypothetical protein FOA52_002896 [Chlamydomonas sp. UWO 241]